MRRPATTLIAGLLVLLLTACTVVEPRLPVNKGWQLDPSNSRIDLFVVKADQVGENFQLSPLTGSVSTEGQAQITVPLSSIQTGLPVRNARMEKYLFESDKYPDLSIKTFIQPKAIAELQEGKHQAAFETDANVSLHGLTRTVPVHFLVTRLGADRVLVQSDKPIAIRAEQFGMNGGVEKLRDLAGLSNITPVVAVTFSLQFEAK